MVERGRPADAPRLAAHEVLTAVRADDAYANLALALTLRERGLTGRDAAFATELVSGTLRGRGLYDAVLADCLDRQLRQVDAAVLDALRLGTHQLLAMRVPTHAAISTTVDLVRAVVGHRPAGFSNAVLRKVSARDLASWVERLAPDEITDPVGRAAIAHSHPRWVVELLGDALGHRRDELAALLAADNEPPRVTLVARPGRSSVDELPGKRTAFSPYGVVLDAGDPGAVPAVAAGRAGVQDEGSQLVALVVARAGLEGPDARWLDLCAGPGAKTALLAGLAAARDARLLAVERLPHRAGLVARTLAGASGVLGIVAADGTRPAWPDDAFDRVLVDAPCTGLGALRRRPEARWRRTRADLAQLVPLQRALLGAALDAVRPGGVVVYATCSPVLAETAGVVGRVLAERRDVRVDNAAAQLRDVPDCDGPLPGTVQLWPHRHGTDAMFVALLRRSS